MGSPYLGTEGLCVVDPCFTFDIDEDEVVLTYVE